MNIPCPFCNLESCQKDERPGGKDGSNYNCDNCGRFFLSRKAEECISGKDEIPKAILSRAIWNMQKGEIIHEIDNNKIESILNNKKLPTPAEQANNAIMWLGTQKQNPADYVNIIFPNFAAKIGSIPDIKSVHYILQTLWNKKIIQSKGDVDPIGIIDHPPSPQNLKDAHRWFRLTFEGWEKFEELKRGISDSKKVFMAMPYGDISVSKAYEEFKMAAEKAGFKLYKLSDDPKAGLIDDRIRVEIRLAHFLVADLTGNNNGAYWESGFAEGLGKKVIYTCEKKFFDKKETHFDTNHLLTIRWEEDKLGKAAEELKYVIRNTFSDAKMED